MTPFDPPQGLERHALDAAAQAIARAASVAGETLVLIVRPGREDHRVYGEGGNGVVRAAVSVAEAAGNARTWTEAPIGYTVARPVSSLPSVVSDAAEQSGLRAVHVAAAAVSPDRPDCIALWFVEEADTDPETEERRRETIQVLAAAAHRDARQAEEQAAAEQRAAALRGDDADNERDDELQGLVDADAFELALEECEADQATVVVIELDQLDEIAERYGADTAKAVATEAGRRLRATCRGNDVLAVLGPGRYGLLLADVDRATALAVSKRLVAAVAQPLDPGLGPETVTASVGLAHQAGMPDTAELLDSATSAAASGHTAGGDRLIVAS